MSPEVLCFQQAIWRDAIWKEFQLCIRDLAQLEADFCV